jgi:hypothetical protein
MYSICTKHAARQSDELPKNNFTRGTSANLDNGSKQIDNEESTAILAINDSHRIQKSQKFKHDRTF